MTQTTRSGSAGFTDGLPQRYISQGKLLHALAERRVSGNIPGNTSAERAALIESLSRNELIASEQYIDIVTGRTFRESILIHAGMANAVDLHAYGVTAERGFLPIADPGVEIPLANAEWHEAARQLPALIPTGRIRSIIEALPAGRWGKPVEIARLAVYLASDDADFVHGSAYVMDGGWLLP